MRLRILASFPHGTISHRSALLQCTVQFEQNTLVFLWRDFRRPPTKGVKLSEPAPQLSSDATQLGARGTSLDAFAAEGLIRLLRAL